MKVDKRSFCKIVMIFLLLHGFHTWRTIPGLVSVVRITPIHKRCKRPFGRGTTRSLGGNNDHHGTINHWNKSWDDPPSNGPHLYTPSENKHASGKPAIWRCMVIFRCHVSFQKRQSPKPFETAWQNLPKLQSKSESESLWNATSFNPNRNLIFL